MRKTIRFSTLALVVVALAWAGNSSAEARHRHRHHHHHHKQKTVKLAHKQFSARPHAFNVNPGIDERSMADGAMSVIGRPLRYIAGRLICAINVNASLAADGIRGTGSAMAKSFLHWGQPSSPVPGAVAIFDRGGRKGHVARVSRVVNGKVYLWNPGRHGWREIALYKQPIAYRVPG